MSRISVSRIIDVIEQEGFCSECPYIEDDGLGCEFWGEPCSTPDETCPAEFMPDDKACPRHDEWLEKTAAANEDDED